MGRYDFISARAGTAWFGFFSTLLVYPAGFSCSMLWDSDRDDPDYFGMYSGTTIFVATQVLFLGTGTTTAVGSYYLGGKRQMAISLAKHHSVVFATAFAQEYYMKHR